MTQNYILYVFIFICGLVGEEFIRHNIAPTPENWWAVPAILTCVFLMVFCFFTFLFFFGAEIFAQERLGDKSFSIAARRGFFVGIFILLMGILSLFNLAQIWIALFLGLFIFLCEMLFWRPAIKKQTTETAPENLE